MPIGLIGLGTLCASLLLLLQKAKPKPWRDLVLGLLLLAVIPGVMWLVALVRIPITARNILISAGSLVGGLGNGLLVIEVGTLLQLLTPAETLGRVGGLFQSTAVAGQLAGLLIPPLLVPGLLAVGGYFGLMAVALLLLAAGFAFLIRRQGFFAKAVQHSGEKEEIVEDTPNVEKPLVDYAVSIATHASDGGAVILSGQPSQDTNEECGV